MPAGWPLGWLDRLPRPIRHLLIGLLVVLLTWLAEDGLPAIGPWLADHPPLGPLAGAALTQLLLYLTPLVRSYGATWGPSARTAPAPGDAGRARLALIGAVVLVLLAGASAPAVASAVRPHRPAFGWVGVTCAEEVDPVPAGRQILISYRMEDQQGHAMVPRVEDSGVLVRVETHQVGSRFGFGGQWAVLGHAAGEARWLAVVPPETQVDQVRVTRLDVGVTSVPWPIGGCSWGA